MSPADLRRNNGLLFKVCTIVFLVVISWIPTFFVRSLTTEREGRAGEAQAEIATKWSRAQKINGPVLTIPRKTVTMLEGKQTAMESLIFLLPSTLGYAVDMDTDVRSRGIFEAPVYTSTVKGTGTFTLAEIDPRLLTGTVEWEKARLSVGIPDPRGIESSALAWNEGSAVVEPGVAASVLGDSGISAPITINRNMNENRFALDLVLRGSEKIEFVPLGRETNISLTSDWPSPSFSGEFLPKDHTITPDGFQAQWIVGSFGRALPQSWAGSVQSPDTSLSGMFEKAVFGVSLHQDVDFYTLTDRAIKYAVLFIALTFLSFFMFEILSNMRIHPMNYLFVGVAIALFYLLLLSFAENIGFLYSYLVSTLAITILITGYCRAVLNARKKAGIIAVILGALYSYLYVLLQLDELALIFGSVLLFGILSTVMYLTRHINWYDVSERKTSS